MALQIPFGFKHTDGRESGFGDDTEEYELELSSWDGGAIATLAPVVKQWAEDHLRSYPIDFSVTLQATDYRSMSDWISPSVILRVLISDYREPRHEAFDRVRPEVLALLDHFARSVTLPPVQIGPLKKDHPSFEAGRPVTVSYGPYRGEKGHFLRKSTAPNVHWIRLSDGRDVEIGDDLVDVGH